MRLDSKTSYSGTVIMVGDDYGELSGLGIKFADEDSNYYLVVDGITGGFVLGDLVVNRTS